MNPSPGVTASASIPAVAARTASPEARPEWQVVQVALPPSPITVTPEGRTALSSACAVGVWQAAQPITALIAAGLSTTPAALPSAPMKSRKPGSEWQAAQFSGTAPSLFQ